MVLLGGCSGQAGHDGVDERQPAAGPRRRLARPAPRRRDGGRRCRDRGRDHGHRFGGRRPDDHPIQLSRPVIQAPRNRRSLTRLAARRHVKSAGTQSASVRPAAISGAHNSARERRPGATVRCSEVTEGRVDRQRRQHAGASSPPTLPHPRAESEGAWRQPARERRSFPSPPTTIAILESIQKASLRDRHAFIK